MTRTLDDILNNPVLEAKDSPDLFGGIKDIKKRQELVACHAAAAVQVGHPAYGRRFDTIEETAVRFVGEAVEGANNNLARILSNDGPGLLYDPDYNEIPLRIPTSELKTPEEAADVLIGEYTRLSGKHHITILETFVAKLT